MWRRWTGCTRDIVSTTLTSVNVDETYPSTLSEAVEAELVGDLSGIHGVL
jgi:hypothetical protein